MDLTLLLALVLQLGSPSYAAREQADGALRALLPASAPLVKWGRRLPGPETAARCAVIWRNYVSDTAAAKAAKTLPRWYRVHPWLDMLPGDYPNRNELVEYYLGEARSRLGIGPNDSKVPWDDFRWATKLWLTDLYKAEDGPDVMALTLTLDAMAWKELTWYQKNGNLWTPPQRPDWSKVDWPLTLFFGDR